MGKVFISFGNKNRRLAEALCAWLEGRGIPCWMAPRDISSGTYAGEITRAIKVADVMIAIFSKTSHSEHVKNEVNVAFNNAKLIVPYCLDDNPFDDDLEYWLSSKQRIISCGDKEKDFARIEKIIREHRGEALASRSSASAAKPRKHSLLLSLICFAAVLAIAIFFYLRHDRTPEEAPAQPTDSLTVEIPVIKSPEDQAPAVSASQPVDRAVVKDPDANTFDGKITDGYPDGFGTYTFKRNRRIDMHDPEERMAEVGDYIIGSWTKGHLNQGEWYGADGVKKGFILLGDHQDIEKDLILGKCVKR